MKNELTPEQLAYFESEEYQELMAAAWYLYES